MRVTYPWNFVSANCHFRLKLCEEISLRERFVIRENPHFKTDTSELLITFSDVVSTINEKDKIKYHECIIKVKVDYKGQDYYYPLITFVDDAYSIIRGYYLGFEKCIAGITFSDSQFVF